VNGRFIEVMGVFQRARLPLLWAALSPCRINFGTTSPTPAQDTLMGYVSTRGGQALVQMIGKSLFCPQSYHPYPRLYFIS
jgi:hypothetical protein